MPKFRTISAMPIAVCGSSRSSALQRPRAPRRGVPGAERSHQSGRGPRRIGACVARCFEHARYWCHRPAIEYGRYGYRKVAALLRQAGWTINDKRVERIWQREGLTTQARQALAGRRILHSAAAAAAQSLSGSTILSRTAPTRDASTSSSSTRWPTNPQKVQLKWAFGQPKNLAEKNFCACGPARPRPPIAVRTNGRLRPTLDALANGDPATPNGQTLVKAYAPDNVLSDFVKHT
jgi:hypothetical protein